MLDPINTPCFQSKASYTRGMVEDLLPPKIIASIGTPLGSSHEGSRFGQLEIGTQNLELGCEGFGV